MSEAPYKKIHIIINPASGGDEPILNTLNDVLHDQGVTWEVSITQKRWDAAHFARQAAENGAELIASYGGDGTLSEVINGLIDVDVPLAILPGGTGNAMIEELGIPNTLAGATRLMLQPEATLRPVDAGKVGDRYFLLRVGTGLIGSYSSQVSRELKNQFGVFAYFIGAFRALSQPQLTTYHLTIDGEAVEKQGVAVMIMNTSALGGGSPVKLSRRVDVSDGLLDVFVMPGDLASVVDVARSVTTIQDDLITALYHQQGKRIRLETAATHQIFADGEHDPVAATPNEVQVLPGALQVLVPGATPEGDDAAGETEDEDNGA